MGSINLLNKTDKKEEGNFTKPSINVFMFNRVNITSGIYGIGTYIEELSKGLLAYPNIHFTIIHIGVTNINEVQQINIKNNLFCIYIPLEKGQNDYCETYDNVIVDSLINYISNDTNNIFHFNYSMDFF
jgi:hypothetical protein